MLTGKVVRGKGLGNDIGFPTANLAIKEDYKLIPKHGSYVVSSFIDAKLYFGMMNIGINPTVNGKTESIEVHFFEFNKYIYNKKIQINLLKRLRNEVKFESVETLKLQLFKDKEISLQYIKSNFK